MSDRRLAAILAFIAVRRQDRYGSAAFALYAAWVAFVSCAERGDLCAEGQGGRMRRVVIVNDKMQQGYRYELSAPVGRDFDPQFRPDLTPKQMLELGVFCGKYLTDCRDEYPASWFARAKLYWLPR
jgi:hypothetical protein